jgi:hypothetical protein
MRLSEGELAVLDQLADGLGLTRSETVRLAIHELGRSEPVKRRDRFAESLRERFGREAQMRIELDERFDAVVTVDGVPCPDLYVPTLHTQFGQDHFVQIWLGDVAADDVRLFLGMIPARTGVPLTVPLADLSAAMQPRAVAWFTGVA